MNELTTKTSKSFWQKKEGITGMLFLAAIGFGLYTLIPTLIVLAANTIYLGFMFAVIGGVVYVALDPKFRTLVGYVYKTTMRKITGVFINLNPIAILESYIEDMKQNREVMFKQVTNLRGNMQQLQDVIVKNKAEKEANLARANKAQQTGQSDQTLLMSRKAGRLEKSNMTLQTLYTKLEMLYRALTKMYEISGIVLEDTADEVSVKKREQIALTGASSAFRSALKILKGDPDKKYMFDMAMENLVDDIGAKAGEMESFMELSANIIASVDLDNAVFEEKGFAELEKWQNAGASFLLGNEKPILIAKAQNSREVLDLTAAPKVLQVDKKKKYTDIVMEN